MDRTTGKIIRDLSWLSGKLSSDSEFSSDDRDMAYQTCLLAIEQLRYLEECKTFFEKLP